MVTRFIQAAAAVGIVVACLSAPLVLVAIGGQFRIAARMSGPSPVASPDGDGSDGLLIATVADRDGRW